MDFGSSHIHRCVLALVFVLIWHLGHVKTYIHLYMVDGALSYLTTAVYYIQQIALYPLFCAATTN